MPRNRSRHGGASLVEIAVALAITAALCAMAVPAYARWMAEQRLLEEARRLSLALTLARSEAIKRNGRVELCAAPTAAGCAPTGGWNQGFLVFQDLAGDGDYDAGDPVLVHEPASPAGTSIVGNAPVARYVSFTHSGHARRADGALQMGTFTVCATGLRAIKVVLANSGRTRIDRDSATCP
jgi:type IV fimbrial biogenesis protein FimT